MIELGGPDTFARPGSWWTYLTGVFTGFGPQSNLLHLQMINGDISGICVGSAEHFQEMNHFTTKHGIRPVIDRSFNFEDVPTAFEYMASRRHFDKIVIEI